MEKIIDLNNGLSIYKANVDELRERDENARVMPSDVFDRLKQNIKDDSRLESLPFCHIIKRQIKGEETIELGIISGHHRTRAARMAGITDIFVIVDETELTEDQIKSKQLSHNSLNGSDNEQLLKKIYDSIQDVNQKIKSGVYQDKLNEAYKRVNIDEVGFDFDFEIIKILFLSNQLKKFDDVCKLIEKNEQVLLADYKDFNTFSEAIRKVSSLNNIRSIAAIINKMSEIILNYYDGSEK